MSELNLAEYREFVRGCIHPGVIPSNLERYARLGYLGELGEAFQLLSKALRTVTIDDPLSDDRWEQFVQECGDMLHYWMQYQISSDSDEWTDYQSGFSRLPRRSPIFISKNSSIRAIDGELFSRIDFGFPKIVVLPEMTIEQLAYINQQKLLARRDELGVFAKE